MFKYFLIATDNNGRQYLFQITEDGLAIQTVNKEVIATVEEPQLQFIMEQIKNVEPFIISDTLFNPSNLNTIKFQAYPADEI